MQYFIEQWYLCYFTRHCQKGRAIKHYLRLKVNSLRANGQAFIIKAILLAVLGMTEAIQSAWEHHLISAPSVLRLRVAPEYLTDPNPPLAP